ncbi:MAG TPA: GYD domain-containing protein [Burkholderiales bacterium]|nr:GYD domain-containing protein [Burkholderiales bacterium]
MAKYLIKSSYTVEGTKGLLKEGGSGRRAAVAQMVQGLGGKLEVFYYAFGEPDVYAIVDVPDTISAAAASLVINSKGAARVSTTPLITPEEIDAACKKSVAYRAPGA